MPIDFNNAHSIHNVNTGNLGGDPRQVLRLSNSLQKCKNFGKAWDVGDQGTVFYPFKCGLMRACPPVVPSSLTCPPTSATPCPT